MPNHSNDDPDLVVTGYGPGKKEMPQDHADCLAKKVFDRSTGITRFWLKRATDGPNKRKLYNPHWPLFERRATYEFAKATEESFLAYLKFLSSDNPVFLLHAERAIV